MKVLPGVKSFWTSCKRALRNPEQKRARWCVLAALTGIALAGFSSPLPAREKASGSVQVSGVVAEVHSARLVIRAQDGAEVVLTPLEDFTGKLAVGSRVNAWYFVQGGVKVMERLDYAVTEAAARAPDAKTTPGMVKGKSAPPAASEKPEPRLAGVQVTPPPELPSDLKIRKIILLPSSSVPDAEGVFDAMENHLKSNFGWYVAPRVLAEEIRKRARKSSSALDALNPETGDFDMNAYLEGQQSLAGRIAEETRVDAVLEVNVEEVVARVHRMLATWDGVEEAVSGKGSRAVARIAIVGANGRVSASTVVLNIYDARGNLVWSNRRGLAVLWMQEGLGSKLRYRPLTEYLQDSAAVQKWLEAAFDSLRPLTALDQSAARKTK